MIQIAIVEDNEKIAQLLKATIDNEPEFTCVALYPNAETALKGIPELLPDVVLMDIGLPGINGIEAIKRLKPECPSVEFMMCTVYDEDEKVFEALENGANAYILKSSSPAEMIGAIKELNDGGSPMSSDIARKVVQRMQRSKKADLKELYGITKREAEILGLLAKGMMYKEIADALFISEKTMRKHIYNIYEKLHVHSKVEAINKYYGR